VQYCTVDGVISGNGHIGGILGSGEPDIAHCTNSASVTATGSSVGGIIGGSAWSIEDCENYGNIAG